MATQVKLLRFLQERVIERVGVQRPIPVDVRMITATNQDLPRLRAQNRFRDDLFYRINVIPITLPPRESGGKTSLCWWRPLLKGPG